MSEPTLRDLANNPQIADTNRVTVTVGEVRAALAATPPAPDVALLATMIEEACRGGYLPELPMDLIATRLAARLNDTAPAPAGERR